MRLHPLFPSFWAERAGVLVKGLLAALDHAVQRGNNQLRLQTGAIWLDQTRLCAEIPNEPSRVLSKPNNQGTTWASSQSPQATPQNSAKPEPPRPPPGAAHAMSKSGHHPIEQLRHDGTRVVPVFVFSLAEAPPDLTFCNHEMVYATRDLVLVLQPLKRWGGRAARAGGPPHPDGAEAALGRFYEGGCEGEEGEGGGGGAAPMVGTYCRLVCNCRNAHSNRLCACWTSRAPTNQPKPTDQSPHGTMGKDEFYTGHFTNGRRLSRDGRDATRHIIAGLAQAVAGARALPRAAPGRWRGDRRAAGRPRARKPCAADRAASAPGATAKGAPAPERPPLKPTVSPNKPGRPRAPLLPPAAPRPPPPGRPPLPRLALVGGRHAVRALRQLLRPLPRRAPRRAPQRHGRARVRRAAGRAVKAG